MMQNVWVTAVLTTLSIVVVSPGMAAQLTAPALVQSSLKRFAHDDSDMERHAAANAYERLAKEEEDFARDADLLRAAIHDEPAAFQRTVEVRIHNVLTASHQVAIAGRKPVEADVHHALDALAKAVRELNAEFPEALRPSL